MANKVVKSFLGKLWKIWCKNKLVILIILALLTLSVVFISLYVEKEHFTHDNSKMVLYHLNGCHHCEKLMPVWNKLKQTHGAHMVEYEATAHPELMKAHGIHSFPTIMKGQHKYEGPRTAEGLLGFLMTQKGGTPGVQTSSDLLKKAGEIFGGIAGGLILIVVVVLLYMKSQRKSIENTNNQIDEIHQEARNKKRMNVGRIFEQKD